MVPHMAESFFSHLRRAETGHHHHIAGAYLARYAQESAWREGHRRGDNGQQRCVAWSGWRCGRGLQQVLAAGGCVSYCYNDLLTLNPLCKRESMASIKTYGRSLTVSLMVSNFASWQAWPISYEPCGTTRKVFGSRMP